MGVAILPSQTPQVLPSNVSLAPGADTSSTTGASYANLPAGLSWQQFLAPITNDPVYYAQAGNTAYYVGPNNQLYQGSPSNFYFSNSTSTPGQYQSTSANNANFVNPLPSAAKVSWNTLETALGITPTSSATTTPTTTTTTTDPFTALTQALATLASQSAPQASLPAVPDASTTGSDTVVPTTTGGGPNIGMVLLLFLIAGAAFYWWYKKHHGASHESAHESAA